MMAPQPFLDKGIHPKAAIKVYLRGKDSLDIEIGPLSFIHGSSPLCQTVPPSHKLQPPSFLRPLPPSKCPQTKEFG